MRADYIIVGSGVTGATIARQLADAGRDVAVVERRAHAGGNVADYVHSSGIRIHRYGPHYFRTNSKTIWDFVNRFTEFFPYEAVVKSDVNGRLEHWPVNAAYVARECGPDWKPEFGGRPGNFEQACLSKMPRTVYERFIRGYTEKQWGTVARNLSPNLAKRFSVRAGNDERLTQHRHQGIPAHGYTIFIRNLLRGIPVYLGVNYHESPDSFSARKCLIYTGPIDELFSFDLGRLQYRAQFREHTYLPQTNCFQPCGQVNNPSAYGGTHIRTIEWKHMMPADQAGNIPGTVITREYPQSPVAPDEYEYPFPDELNARLYRAYVARVESVPRLIVCGRLGEYRYLDMDQAIGRALVVARRLLQERSEPRAMSVRSSA